MGSNLPVLPSDTETIAELRELYRAAEARAARMRLHSLSGGELAEAAPETLDAVLSRCGDRLAFFLGAREATFLPAESEGGIAIEAPGPDGRIVARIAIEGLPSLDAIGDAEDRETVRLQLGLIGTTIDRIRREKERAELLRTLQDRERSLEILVDRIFTAQEEERRRVSQELHDGVAQTATALVRMLEGMETVAPDLGGEADPVRPVEVARGLVSELRRVIAGLRPTLLDDLGFVPALRFLCQSLEADGFEVSFAVEGESSRLSPLVETALFRVAQEAVANIRKHAGGPCKVFVEANLSPERAQRVLRLTDYGGGPSAATRASTPGDGRNVGIEVMRERMTAIGGRLEWKAGEPDGVVVEAWLPQG